MKSFILVILHPFCSLQFLPSLVGIADSETEQLGSQSGSFGVVCVCVYVSGMQLPTGLSITDVYFPGKSNKNPVFTSPFCWQITIKLP